MSHLTPSLFQIPNDSQQHIGWIVCLVAGVFTYHNWVCPVSLAKSPCLNLPHSSSSDTLLEAPGLDVARGLTLASRAASN